MRRLFPSFFLLLGAVTSGCFPPSDGAEPPPELLHFPVGVALDATGDRLYVANSNFDLQYRSGRIVVFDAARIRELLPDFSLEEPCSVLEPVLGERTEKTYAELAVSPGLCCPVFLNPGVRTDSESDVCGGRAQGLGADPFGVVKESVKISAFATDLTYQKHPTEDWGRLFIPARGDATLHWADVRNPANGEREELDCGQASSGADCDADHRRGDDDSETAPSSERLTVEPFAVAVSDDGRAVVTTHRTQGTVALFTNDWDAEVGPELAQIVPGLPIDPMGVAAVPGSALARSQDDYNPAFIISFFQTPAVISLFRFFDADSELGETCDPRTGCLPGPTLRTVGSRFITPTNAADSRGVAVDDSDRRTCEAGCGADMACLTECAGVPLGIYLANRSPAALLVGQTEPNYSSEGTGDLPNLFRAVPVRTGPSRVTVGRVRGVPEEEALRIFLVAFDTRTVYIYDPRLQEIEARVFTGRGPHALAVDSAHGLGYLGHFTDSHIGVIDLTRCLTGPSGEVVTPCQPNPHYAEILLTIGQPTPPKAAK